MKDKLEFMFNSSTARNKDIEQLEHFAVRLLKTQSDPTGRKVWK